MLRAHFVYLPGYAILSLAFRGSAGIINYGTNGLTSLENDGYITD